MKNIILPAIEGLVVVLTLIGLGIGVLIWAFFGYVDITNSSSIGWEANHILVGTLGLLLCISNGFGIYAIRKESLSLPLATAIAIIFLSLAFAHYSPLRLGAIFGHGDPARYAVVWSIVTGILLILGTLLGMARNRFKQSPR